MKFLKSIVFVTIPTLLFLWFLLELFFRWIIPAAEIPLSYFDETENIYRFDENTNTEGVHTIGQLGQQKANWQINNKGWLSTIDYESSGSEPLIAIIGDSYVEALQVNADQSFPSLIRKALKGQYRVYSFGKSGAPLSQYLHYSRYVKKHFNPKVIIFNVVHNDFIESLNAFNPNDKHFLTLKSSADTIVEVEPIVNYNLAQYSFAKRLVAKSALFRYAYLNLNLKGKIGSKKGNKNKEVTVNANINVSKVLKHKIEITKGVDYVFSCLNNEQPKSRIIFVIDAPRRDIYRGNKANSNVLFLNKLIADMCQKYGFEYIDLTTTMQNDFKLNKIKFNSELDDHWDQYGHKIVAKQLLKLF
ncbi:MAG: SGNH/GDSL hydrolase family protein [Bacteroidia bacterium]